MRLLCLDRSGSVLAPYSWDYLQVASPGFEWGIQKFPDGTIYILISVMHSCQLLCEAGISLLIEADKLLPKQGIEGRAISPDSCWQELFRSRLRSSAHAQAETLAASTPVK